MSISTAEKAAGSVGNFLDERISGAKGVKFFARKIFPDHWSFLLGEVALYSFIILLLSGTFLTFFFIPSVDPVTYEGSYKLLEGQEVSQAFASTMHLTFDVRGGLLLRQIHHWAALIFTAALIVHMFRVFFTGAFRKPRELNWVIGVTMAMITMFEGFLGYSLPDDLLSGNGLRIASGIILAIPVVGSYVSFFLFGGQFPGEAFIPRIYTIHVLLLPGILLALITVHLFLVVLHKHTQYPGPGRNNGNVQGFPLFPIYTAKAGGFFFVVFGITTLMAAWFTINPIQNYGSYDPSPIGAGAQPDWYMGFMDGAVRLTPGFLELSGLGYTLSLNIAIPALILPGILTNIAILYPWIEAWATGDKREHHVLDRPRNVPTRTGLGAMAISFYILLWISGGNDIIATHLHLSINDITVFLRAAIFIIPPLVYLVAKRIALGLQRKDREKVLHGRETGRVFRDQDGRYFELHEPLDPFNRWELVAFESYAPSPAPTKADKAGVRKPLAVLGTLQHKLSTFYFQDRVEPVTPRELAAAHSHGEHDEISASGGSEPQGELSGQQ
ncbi:cytochrome bc complex cytochrome b subunit [Spongisporangium articulatum]|uniref:Cytochrome bc1 complex cytochrome b subunit n=1 Tax=Spongisporangium articulatum TaxID=3362603 RepID=A0ABW8ASX0_9ACTN